MRSLPRNVVSVNVPSFCKSPLTVKDVSETGANWIAPPVTGLPPLNVTDPVALYVGDSGGPLAPHPVHCTTIASSHARLMSPSIGCPFSRRPVTSRCPAGCRRAGRRRWPTSRGLRSG